MKAAQRELTLFDATMLVMGGIIGVGIFFNPQAVARLVPNESAYFSMWLLGGLVALAGAMTFAELAGTFPRSGGWFVFLREAFGPFPAFLFAWIVLFVVSTGACAVIADFSARQFVTLLWPAGAPPAYAAPAIGYTILVGITGLALAGVKRTAVFQNICMVLKLSAIATFVLAAFAVARATGATQVDAPHDSLASGMLQASLPVLFSFGGWQLVTYIAPNVRDPQRTLPRSILLGVSGVVVVYLALNYAFVRVLGMEGLAEIDGFTTEMARRTLGEKGQTVLVAAMAVSSLGVCTAILLATPGIYVAMARSGLFLKSFGREHPSTGAPVLALLVQGTIAISYFSWGEAGLLTDAVVFTEWIFHAQCAAALLYLRKRNPELPRPFVSFAYPLFPVVYLSLAVLVVCGTLARADMSQTLLGLGVLAVGAVVYLPWKRLVGGPTQ